MAFGAGFLEIWDLGSPVLCHLRPASEIARLRTATARVPPPPPRMRKPVVFVGRCALAQKISGRKQRKQIGLNELLLTPTPSVSVL